MKIQKRATQRFDLVLQFIAVIVVVLGLTGCVPSKPDTLTHEECSKVLIEEIVQNEDVTTEDLVDRALEECR